MNEDDVMAALGVRKRPAFTLAEVCYVLCRSGSQCGAAFLIRSSSCLKCAPSNPVTFVPEIFIQSRMCLSHWSLQSTPGNENTIVTFIYR